MRSEWHDDPDARSNVVPILTGMAVALPVGVALGILIGVRIALGAGG